VARRHETIRGALHGEITTLRSRATGQHRRTPEVTANLGVGLRYFLRFAREVGALTQGESDVIWDQLWTALLDVAERWGGEQNDVFTTQLVIGGKRRRAAFAFKGPAYKGMLRPKHMGKNGDQIQRLFKSPADVFIVQHHTQIHESILDQMVTSARLLAGDSNADVFYGTIEGKDSNRLIAAYPKAFAAED
jgi:hypothetical protein